MLRCEWCGQAIDSYLYHVCADGTTFYERAERARNGGIPPLNSLSKNLAKNEQFTRLTLEDLEFLKSLKIKW